MSDGVAPSVNTPLVSVIVTAYNQATTIAQTLDCILKQECNFSVEIVIGDDCSTDGTRDICLTYQKKFPGKIKLVFNETNGGVAKNFVIAVRHAQGKYIGMCAADDYWHNPNKLKLQADFLEANPDYGLVYTDYDILDPQTGKIEKNHLTTSGRKCPEGSGLVKEVFKGKVPMLTHTVFFRKEVYDKHVHGEDYIKYKFPIEDWPTWLIISKFSKIKYFPVSTSTYRSGHESLSNPQQYDKIEKKYAAEHRMYKYLCDRFPEDLVYDEKVYVNYINTILLNLAYKKKDYPAAKKYAMRLINNGFTSNKVRMAKNRLTFILFSLFKKIQEKRS